MSKRSDLKARLHTLGEIRSILNAMRNLAVIETAKVSRYLGAQNELMAAIEEAVGDFWRHFGGTVGNPRAAIQVYILIGSERGFCGGFNDGVITRFLEEVQDSAIEARVVTVGRKLASRLEGRMAHLKPENLGGANSAEEVAAVINELAQRLTRYPDAEWRLIHPTGETGGIPTLVSPSLHFRKERPESKVHDADPPLLNLPPTELYAELWEQYLYSMLYRGFYVSFLAENRERLRHMEGALSALEKSGGRMRRISNQLRQEEITEELEIIMQNVVP